MEETRRIVPIDVEHIEAIQELASDPLIGATSNVPSPYPEGGAAWFINDTLQKRQAGTEYTFAIVDNEQLVGVCGLLSVHDKSAELGYWVGVPFWGKGYATFAARSLVSLGFDRLELERIFSRCIERNQASRRVLEKIGFQFMGWKYHPELKWGASERFAHYAIGKEV